ncbi:MAG: DUF177 domain-containing protein [Anaerolineales bacterium]|nr:DUF177 domain-containing protein [Anaerolineales bacterium]
MIRFDVSTLMQARVGSSLDFAIDMGPCNLTDLEVTFLRGFVRVTRVQAGLLVQGAVDAEMRLECVRCLEPCDIPATLELEETFRLPGTKPRPDLPYSVTDDGWIDLVPLIREQGWVAVPIKPICDPQCKGLCPQCGTNLNVETCACRSGEIDPRWASLQDLL